MQKPMDNIQNTTLCQCIPNTVVRASQKLTCMLYITVGEAKEATRSLKEPES